MSDKKVLSFDDYVGADDSVVEEVETKRGLLKVATVNSEEILDWFAENDASKDDGTPDTDQRRFKGLRLLVRAIVNEDGSRIPKELRPSALEALKAKDHRENGRLIAAAFRVNGLSILLNNNPPADAEARKNDSGEATPDASPTASR